MIVVPPHLPPGLVEVLRDWTALEAPPLQILHRASHRSTERVQWFVDFAASSLRALLPEAQPASAESIKATQQSDWWDRRALVDLTA